VSRCQGDPVDVVRRDDAPEQFLWRDRLYLVRDVLARWTETAAWWEGTRARAATAGDGPGLPTGGAGPAAGPAGPAALEEQEREFWRVEAGSGRVAAARAGGTGGLGVYDLCFDWSRGQWSLSRVVD